MKLNILGIVSALLIASAHAALTYKGADWSSLLVEEKAGISYKTADGIVKPLETILRRNGVNTVRQRVWNDPVNGTYNLDYNLKLAKRAHTAGLEIYIDFHFSDTWADPSHQATPAAWVDYDIDNLINALYNYTRSTMNAFASAEVPVSLVSIGNEITNGMLWPLGEISTPSGPYNLARLLHSASAGIKDSTLARQPKILIHLDNGWNFDTQRSWYDLVLGQGPLSARDFDVQAVSYYPFYNSSATLSALRSSLKGMASRYGKELLVVETDWPVSCPDPMYAFPSDTKEIPISAVGRSEWMRDVAKEVESAGGMGVFYWEPAWINNAGLGSSCENNLMFDDDGKALSSLAVFESLSSY